MSNSESGDSESALDPATQRRAVRERYARIATGSDAGSGDSDDVGAAGNADAVDDADAAGDAAASGCCSSEGCCGDESAGTGDTAEAAERLGYDAADVDRVGGDANLGLGCGNPKALASMAPGETVLDLGSGAGFDCFLAAREVGEAGRVVGVDMTPEMVEKARENAAANESENVEFRLGEIEHLPVGDDSVDVVISNCVVNLSPDKPRAFAEAFRVLRPGGRLAISDVVLTADVPRELRADPTAVASCVAGASTIDRLERLLADAGFEAVDVSPVADSDRFIREWDDRYDLSEYLVSASITGRKPE